MEISNSQLFEEACFTAHLQWSGVYGRDNQLGEGACGDAPPNPAGASALDRPKLSYSCSRRHFLTEGFILMNDRGLSCTDFSNLDIPSWNQLLPGSTVQAFAVAGSP